MPIKIRMIVMTIINSMSVKPFSSRALRRLRNDDFPVRIRDSILNSNPYSSYQSEYFVPSSAVAVDYQSEYFVPSSAALVDFEYTSNTFFPPQLVESGSS